MSIRCMSRVWEKSERGETELLLLLALADWSDDFGYCHPSIDQMAMKIRQSKRNVLRLLEKLEAAGELRVFKRSMGGRGKRIGSIYQVLSGLNQDEIIASEGLSALAQAALETSDKMSPVSKNSDTGVTVSEKTGDIDDMPMSPVSRGALNDLNNVSDINSSSSHAPSDNADDSGTERRAERLYQRLRPNHLMIPRGWYYQEAIMVLNRVLDQHAGDFEAAEAYLRPFVQEAIQRNIAPTNLCWLTEWAAAGKVPPRRRGAAFGNSPKPVVESSEERSKQEAILDIDDLMTVLGIDSAERRKLLGRLDALPFDQWRPYLAQIKSAQTPGAFRTAINHIK